MLQCDSVFLTFNFNVYGHLRPVLPQWTARCWTIGALPSPEGTLVAARGQDGEAEKQSGGIFPQGPRGLAGHARAQASQRFYGTKCSRDKEAKTGKPNQPRPDLHASGSGPVARLPVSPMRSGLGQGCGGAALTLLWILLLNRDSSYRQWRCRRVTVATHVGVLSDTAPSCHADSTTDFPCSSSHPSGGAVFIEFTADRNRLSSRQVCPLPPAALDPEGASASWEGRACN